MDDFYNDENSAEGARPKTTRGSAKRRDAWDRENAAGKVTDEMGLATMLLTGNEYMVRAGPRNLARNWRGTVWRLVPVLRHIKARKEIKCCGIERVPAAGR